MYRQWVSWVALVLALAGCASPAATPPAATTLPTTTPVTPTAAQSAPAGATAAASPTAALGAAPPATATAGSTGTATPAAVAASATVGPTGTAGRKPLKVAMVVNGVLGDKSFYDSAQAGLERAKRELGVEVRTIQATLDQSKWEPALRDAAAGDYDIILTGTYDMKEHVEAIAPRYPTKRFILFDADADYSKGNLGNVYSVLFKQNEGSFLAGALAALLVTSPEPAVQAVTKGAQTIGFVGAMDEPVINDFRVGFEQGAKLVAPEAKMLTAYVGDWNDPAKGKEVALAQYRQGAAIVFNVASLSGLGVLEAAAESGRYAIGVDADQAALLLEAGKPNQAKMIPTSMLKRVDNAIYRALQMAQAGTLAYGTAEVLGLKEGAVGLAKNAQYEAAVPAATRAKIDELEQQIVRGSITVETVFK